MRGLADIKPPMADQAVPFLTGHGLRIIAEEFQQGFCDGPAERAGAFTVLRRKKEDHAQFKQDQQGTDDEGDNSFFTHPCLISCDNVKFSALLRKNGWRHYKANERN